ncbi:MAG TPA: DUF4382 domain-containing protein [Kofleriaceae bacterium]|nr:DUF4382 domain-containing protein [Kofleriaceae bacterium]
MRLLAGCLFTFLAGCSLEPGSAGSADAGAQVGSTQSSATHLDVKLTDAPAAFDSVFVTISQVRISTAAGWVSLSEQPQRFDLLTLRDDATALLGGTDLAPGSYNQLRLIVDSASVVVGGVESALDVASGAQTGLKLNLDTEIVAGMTYTLVIDFDADKSIKSTGHGYLMTPVIKVKSLNGAPSPSGDAGIPGDAGPPPGDAGPPPSIDADNSGD